MKEGGPTILEAARMNYGARSALRTVELSGWRREDHCEYLGLSRWMSEDGHIYLAISGTRLNRCDLTDSVKVFLGQHPNGRIKQVCDYILSHCKTELNIQKLTVGGHSLGGLVATSVAAEFHLPALVQNAPGYFVSAPDPARCGKIVEIRTARDVVSDWGSNGAHLITLHDPQTAGWNLNRLHAVDRQNELIASRDDLSNVLLKDAVNLCTEDNADTQPTGNTLESILVSYRRLRGHHEDAYQTQNQTPSQLTPKAR